MRFSVGAVNVRTGRFAYFDSVEITIRPEHVMASGALPPGFPPVEIGGELYWDGGLDAAAIRVGLFSASQSSKLSGRRVPGLRPTPEKS
jgi:predicted patatin/cPLA2 family phospholipase